MPRRPCRAGRAARSRTCRPWRSAPPVAVVPPWRAPAGRGGAAGGGRAACTAGRHDGDRGPPVLLGGLPPSATVPGREVAGRTGSSSGACMPRFAHADNASVTKQTATRPTGRCELGHFKYYCTYAPVR